MPRVLLLAALAAACAAPRAPRLTCASGWRQVVHRDEARGRWVGERVCDDLRVGCPAGHDFNPVGGDCVSRAALLGGPLAACAFPPAVAAATAEWLAGGRCPAGFDLRYPGDEGCRVCCAPRGTTRGTFDRRACRR